MINISFEATHNRETISTLKTEWRNSLTFPNESYEEAVIDGCQHWVLKLEEKTIGYACVSKKHTLYQFYISYKYLMHGTVVLEEFIKQRGTKKAIVGTNNPIYLSMIMHFQKSIEIYGYTFKDTEDVSQKERDVKFRVAETGDLEQLLNLDDDSEVSEESKKWLKKYFGDCISKGVIFVLKKNNEIIAYLEVRTSTLRFKITSLGVVVSPKYRNQGYGSYLLVKGKSIGKSRHSETICGCNMKNIISRKTIEKSGFRILHLSLLANL